MPLRSPIRWVGGKYKLRKQIANMLPDKNSYTCYTEVFGGAGWVLFAKEPSPVEIFNDIDRDLINFFVVLRDKHDELIEKISGFPLISRDFFDQLYLQETNSLSDLDRAYRFYYLLMAGWGGEWEKPRFQTSITDLGNGNRLFGALRSLHTRLSLASERISGAIIENLDWRDCIDRYDDSKTVMFLDPPYPGNNCNYSHNMLSVDEHLELAQRLSTVNCRWLLTSYDRADIRSMLSNYHIFPVNFASGMDGENGRQNNEIIVTNYEVAEQSFTAPVVTNSTPDINDEVQVIDGQHKGLKGFVQKKSENLLEIRHAPFKKDDVITVDCSQIEVLKIYSDRDKMERKIQNLRKNISSNIPKEIILTLISLQENGVIKSIPSFVEDSVRNAILEEDHNDN